MQLLTCYLSKLTQVLFTQCEDQFPFIVLMYRIHCCGPDEHANLRISLYGLVLTVALEFPFDQDSFNISSTRRDMLLVTCRERFTSRAIDT